LYEAQFCLIKDLERVKGKSILKSSWQWAAHIMNQT